VSSTPLTRMYDHDFSGPIKVAETLRRMKVPLLPNMHEAYRQYREVLARLNDQEDEQARDLMEANGITREGQEL